MHLLKGRQILDVVLIANEAIDSRLRSRIRGIVCKLDIEKVYDHVNWSFLLKVMGKMSFDQKWIEWIQVCISTANFSVLVNGVPQCFFQSTRGLQ